MINCLDKACQTDRNGQLLEKVAERPGPLKIRLQTVVTVSIKLSLGSISHLPRCRSLTRIQSRLFVSPSLEFLRISDCRCYHFHTSHSSLHHTPQIQHTHLVPVSSSLLKSQSICLPSLSQVSCPSWSVFTQSGEAGCLLSCTIEAAVSSSLVTPSLLITTSLLPQYCFLVVRENLFQQ